MDVLLGKKSHTSILLLIGLIACAAWLGGCSKAEDNQTAPAKVISITLTGDFTGIVELENGPAGSPTRIPAIKSQTAAMLDAPLTLTPGSTQNPASKGREIFARPFRGKDLVIKDFTLGKGWSVWHDERILYSVPLSTITPPEVAQLPAGSKPISTIDFAKSPYGGQVTVMQGTKLIANADLYAPQESWLTIPIPPAGVASVFTVTVDAKIEAPKWIIKLPAGATLPPNVIGAAYGEVIGEGATLGSVVKLPPAATANNTYAVPIVNP